MESKELIFKKAMRSIYNEAVETGIFEDIITEENTPYSIYTETNNGFTAKGNVVTKTKEARMNWLRSRSALALAKANNDPKYAKLVKFSKLRQKYIKELNEKYKSGANAKAKQLIKAYKNNSASPFDKKNKAKTKKQGNNAIKQAKSLSGRGTITNNNTTR